MADAQANETNETVEKNNGSPMNPVEEVVSTIKSLGGEITKVGERMDAVEKGLEEAKKTRYPWGAPNGGSFGIREGENIMSSRPYSLMLLTKRLRLQAAHDDSYKTVGKIEADLSKRLTDAYYGGANWTGFGGRMLVPFGGDLMPIEGDMAREEHLDSGEVIKGRGLPADLVQECRDVMKLNGQIDYDYLAKMAQKFPIMLTKDLSANTATTGGTLVGLAADGELIELLRALEVFSRAGATNIDLPPQGSLRMPKLTSAVTVAATSEAATLTESTPGTGALTLTAKPYGGFVDVPDELLRFATSASIEAWLRGDFARELALLADRDMISGAGGTSIEGIINRANVNLRVASDVNANGDGLRPQDLQLLQADIADQNAPIEQGFFYAMTNLMWATVRTRRGDVLAADDQLGEFMFHSQAAAVGGGRMQRTVDGDPVITSTQIPTDRAKGSASDLTMVLAGVGREWIIARAGVVEVDVTDSDGTKFQQRLSTLRGTQYIDAGPRHAESFGYIDDIDEAAA